MIPICFGTYYPARNRSKQRKPSTPQKPPLIKGWSSFLVAQPSKPNAKLLSFIDRHAQKNAPAQPFTKPPLVLGENRNFSSPLKPTEDRRVFRIVTQPRIIKVEEGVIWYVTAFREVGSGHKSGPRTGYFLHPKVLIPGPGKPVYLHSDQYGNAINTHYSLTPLEEHALITDIFSQAEAL